MSERKKIEERLHKKEQEIAALEEKAKTARVYVQALRDILKLLGGDDGGGDAHSSLKQGSAVADARQVILTRGSPVHIDVILEALGKTVSRETKASLTSSLAAYVRRGEIFARTAPNTFGLTELGHEAASEDPRHPPDDFGRDSRQTDDDIPF